MKKLRNLEAKRTFVGWFLLGFWLVETIWFLILEGWHWEATNPNEIIMDKAVYWMCVVWLVLFIRSINIIIEAVIEGEEEQ